MEPVRYALMLLAFSLFTINCSLIAVSAQEDDAAPPPVKVITKEDRTKLDAVADLKVRTKLAVDMLKLKVDTVEKLDAKEDFDGVFSELGRFRGLLDYTIGFLQKQDAKQNKTLDNYKRLELFLRSAAPRLEVIRRDLPLRYDEYVREFQIYIRDARRKVIEPLFGDTVLPGDSENGKMK